MKFEWPILAWAALPVGALALWLLRHSAARTCRRLERLVAPRLREALVRSVDFRKRRFKSVLVISAVTLGVLALARPQLGFQPLELERTSVDFLVALDLSRSMLVEDAGAASRLKAAKAAIESLLDRLGGDRIGIIAFAGEAFVAAPITADHEAVRRNLRALDTNSIAKPGSDLAAAMRLAVKTFAKGDYDSKALVLVTDGEELQGEALIAAREAAAKGVSIFSVGVGSQSGARIPMPLKQAGELRFAKNEFGREVVSRMNERVLQQIAATGRGFYEPLGSEGAGLVSVYHRGLQPLGHTARAKPSKDMVEYFQWPLALTIALLLGELLMNDRRRTSTA